MAFEFPAVIRLEGMMLLLKRRATIATFAFYWNIYLMFLRIPNDEVLKRFAFDRYLSKNRNICSNLCLLP